MAGPVFQPVMEPYVARVLVGFLAQAFNPHAVEVDPVRSPMWPVAQRMAEAMCRGGYHLGAYSRSSIAAERPHAGGAPPSRQVSVTPRTSYGHADVLAQAGG